MTATPGPTVLILGANGHFGLAAAQAFDAAGWRVLAQVRRDPAPGMPKAATLLRTPIDDATTLAQEASEATVVVHALNPAYTRWEEELLPLGRKAMDLTQRLRAGLILPGNVYNFGAGMPPLLREDTVQQPTTRKGRLRVALEDEMQARVAQGLKSVVLRAGDFFGGGRGSWIDLVIAKSVRRGRLVYPGPLDRIHAWAYLPDLARACVAVAGLKDLPPFTRLHFAGHSVTGAELLETIERAAAGNKLWHDGPMRRGTLPWSMIRAGGLVVPMWREIGEMRYLWEVPHALDGRPLERAVGTLPATLLLDALRASLAAPP